jgi:hypothetical protein
MISSPGIVPHPSHAISRQTDADRSGLTLVQTVVIVDDRVNSGR